MSNLDSPTQGASGAGSADLQEELNSLRQMISAVLILLIVFSCSLDVYLLKQVSNLRIQLAVASTRFDYEAHNFNTAGAIETWNRLMQYSRTHPEYAAVIDKYVPHLNETLLGNAAARQ